MKKFIIGFFTMITLVTVSNAQSTPVNSGLFGMPSVVTTTSYGKQLDTVVNTGTKVTTPFQIKDWKTASLWGVVVTKISGTVGGSLSLEGSHNGVDWFLLGTATTVTDGSVNYKFSTTEKWLYQRIKFVGAGTMSASFKTTMSLY